MNGSVRDISPRERLDVGWRFADCNLVSPNDANEGN